MSNVYSLEAYRAAIFRGSREKPEYHPDDIPTDGNRTYSPAEIDAWLAMFREDDGDAA